MQETEPASTRSGFRLRFGKFCSTNLCSTNLLCIFFSVVIGLGCSAFALSSYGSGGVSELLESVFVPDAGSNRTGDWLQGRPASCIGSRPLQHHARERVQPNGARNGDCIACGAPDRD